MVGLLLVKFNQSITTNIGFGHPVANLFLKPAEALRVEAIAGGGTFEFSTNQAGLTEYLEVLAHGGLGQGCIAHNVVGDAHVVRRQELHDLESLRVAKRLEHLRQTIFFRGEFGGLCHIVILRYKNRAVKR
jgi:hypothetical protein